MTKALIVATEGPCCAGKTTLSRGLLKELHNVTVAHVKCYADYVGGGRYLPNAVPHTLTEDTDALQELLRIERARTAAALASESDVILLDRGLNTLLAHRYAIEGVTGLPCYASATGILDRTQPPSWPDLVLYLDVTQEAVQDRNNGKFARDSIFINAQFNARVREYFLYASEHQRILWLDATLDPNELVTKAEAHVKQLLSDRNG